MAKTKKRHTKYAETEVGRSWEEARKRGEDPKPPRGLRSLSKIAPMKRIKDA